jgi:transposase-like protein
MEHATDRSDPLDVVRTVREARTANGSTAHRCPHDDCDGHAIRWGSFSGRQRYRCKTCRRTFSDLTCTAFAYAKKLDKWPHYLVLMRQSRTLRQSAQLLDIHVSTAFRWRHALLSRMLAADTTRLAGTVELKEILFAHSRKGSRLCHGPRARGARHDAWRWYQVPRDCILLAYSRTGAAHASTVGGDAVVTDAVREWARSRLADRCFVLARMPRAGPCGSAVRATGHDYHTVRIIADPNPLTKCHTRNVDAYARRLLDWIHRFRGVASKYRDRYLLWHRHVDGDWDLLWARGMIVRGLIQTCHLPHRNKRPLRTRPG